MAITINKYPCLNDSSQSPRLHPVGNPIVYVISSTNTGETNFRYVAKIENQSGGVLSTIKQFPDFNTGYGIFDVSNILKDYVTSSPNFTTSGVTNYTEAYGKYRVVFYEEYVYDWNFDDNFFYSNSASTYNGYFGLTGHTTHNFVVGDRINVVQDAGYTHAEYDGYHVVTVVPDSFSVVLDLPFAGSTPAEGGEASDAYNRRTIVSSSSAATDYSYAIDAEFSHVDWLTYSAITYTTTPNNALANVAGHFFTNVPVGYTVRPNSHMELNVFSKSNSGDTTYSHTYILFDEFNNYIETYKYYGLTTAVDRLNKVICGPGDVSGKTDFIAGKRIDFSGASYYWFILADSTGLVETEIKTFKVDNSCSKYDDIQLLFRDNLGSYLPIHFNLVNIEGVTIERNTFNKNIGSYQTDNWKYNTWDRGITTYNTNKNRNYICNSNWISETDAAYLEELWTSKDVYAKIDNNWLPITITDSSFVKKTRINDRLINYTITFQLSNNQ